MFALRMLWKMMDEPYEFVWNKTMKSVKIDEILFWITVKTFHQYWKSYQSSFSNLWNIKISEIKTIPVDSRLFSKKQGKISEICVI